MYIDIYIFYNSIYTYNIASGKLRVRPWQIGVGRLVETLEIDLFSGCVLIYQRVVGIEWEHKANHVKGLKVQASLKTVNVDLATQMAPYIERI